MLSPRSRALLLPLLISLAGFAVFPACFFPAAQDGLRLGTQRSRGLDAVDQGMPEGGLELTLPACTSAQARTQALSALRRRGWIVDALVEPTAPPIAPPPEMPAAPAQPNQVVLQAPGARPPLADRSGIVRAHCGRNQAWIRWQFPPPPDLQATDPAMPAAGDPKPGLAHLPAMTWQVSVTLREDPQTHRPMPRWDNHPWEELRLLHLLHPGAEAVPGWTVWPAGVPVSYAAAAAHRWDPYTVWDPVRTPPPSGQAGPP